MTYAFHADLGGQPGHGPVTPEPEGEYWHEAFEPKALALTLAMGATGSWIDDTIVLDKNGVASPQIGRGFSIGQAPDIRTGGGNDEVRYNVNAPVSVDGGTGFDKLVILGTEFADDFAITKKGIFGAGLMRRFLTRLRELDVVLIYNHPAEEATLRELGYVALSTKRGDCPNAHTVIYANRRQPAN